MARIAVMASNFPRWKGDVWSPFIYYLAEGLADRGHEVHVLAPHAEGAAAEEQFGNVHIHRFRYAPTRLEILCYGAGILQNLRRQPISWLLVPLFLAAQLFALVGLVRKHRINLVHAHWFIPQGLVASIARIAVNRPIIMTAHAGDVYSARGAFRKGLLRFAANHATSCTVVSHMLAREFEVRTGIAPDVIPMGVDPSLFLPGADRRLTTIDKTSGPNLLFVGRIAEKKGLSFLIRAISEVRTDYPNMRMTIVGDGRIRTDLEALTNKLDLSAIIEFKGSVENEALPDYLRRADIFVIPSIVDALGDQEGLPVVLLEAAACGVPIIATNVGGITDFVTDNETGLLVEPESVDQLANAIRRLSADDRLRARLSQAGRALVEEKFSWDPIFDRFDALVGNALSGSVANAAG